MEATDKKTFYVFLDTSYLREVGFGNSDFRKLLEYSKANVLKIFVSHIAWEEWRTQYFDKAYAKVLKVDREFEALKVMLPGNFILEGLTPPTLTIWKKSEIDAKSREVMAAFAEENKIHVVALAPDHAERAWRRYFDVGVPFNPEQDREHRRKDIPDAWILEAAIDVKGRHSGLIALCSDGKLSDALMSAEIRVCKLTQEVLDEIESALLPQPVPKVEVPSDAAIATKRVDETRVDHKLEVVLSDAQAQFRDLDGKILGYIAYLDSPTKDQLFELLSRSGVSVESAKNVAQRLAISGVITDTGHHYLVANKEAGELAAVLVEAEIIELLESEG
jgi:hypothetical protein